MLKEEKFTYDVTVQLEVQSLLSACIFFKMKELIKMNVQFDDFKQVPRCFSHLGKNGCSITHAELAKYFLVDRKRIEYAIKPLKELGFIGMEYVNVQMGRHPFFFIEDNGKALFELDFKQTRSCNKNVVKQTGCFNCAALYSHILYWNQRGMETLIQSMRLISDYIGITKDKVKLSILKLSEFNLIHTTASTDNRYSLCIVGGGLLKGCIGSPQEGGENRVEGLLKFASASIDSYSRNILTYKQGEEKSPPDFCKKSEEQEGMIKSGHVEISKSDHAELVSTYGEDRVFYAITRYNQAAEEAGIALPGKTKAHLLKYLGYALENEKHKGIQVKKEEDNKPTPEPSEYMKMIVEKHGSIEAFQEEERKRRHEIDRKLKEEKKPVTEPKKVNIEYLKSREQAINEAEQKRRRAFFESLSPEELGGYKIE